MKCYNHHDRDAFGICVHCGKGLCLECMKEDDNGLIFCKNNEICSKIYKHCKLCSKFVFLLLLLIVVILIFS